MGTDQIFSNQHVNEISSIIEAINKGIFGIDELGNCTFINQAALNLLGYKYHDCIGKNMHQLIHFRYKDGNPYPEHLCGICKNENNFEAAERQEEVFWRADGSSFDIRFSSNAIINNGIFKGSVITFSDITDQKKREATLIESEKKYRLIFEESPSPMFIWDFETLKIVDCNTEALIKYGYTRNEFLQLNIREIRPEEDVHLIDAATVDEETYGSIHKGVWRHRKKNGEIMYVEVTGHLIEFNGRRRSLVLINDVTDKNRAENDLKMSEEKLRAATEIAKLGYWQKDINGENHYWSDEFYKICGVSRDSNVLDYNSFFEMVYPDDRENFLNERAKSASAEKEIDFEYRIVLPGGNIKWLHEIGKAVEDQHGGPVVFKGTVQDITTQKLLSLSLEESNLRYSLVTQATSDAIWDWDLTTNSRYWGEGFQSIFGYESVKLHSTISSWIDYLHPGDKVRVLESVYSVIDGTATNWREEYRYQKADGNYAYVVDRGFVIRDNMGKATRMVGAMHDITQRKREEQQLKLLESVVTNTNDAVLITEAQPFAEPGPRIVYVNNAFTRMTGYISGEVIGKTPRILQGPKSDKKELARLNEALRNRQSCEITTINYKKNGEEFWVNFSVSPVVNETGAFTHLIAIERDVTEQKKAEVELKLLAEELSKRNKELQQFGYVISHNLRSPIANIIGIADLLEMEKEDPETIEHCTQSLKKAITSLDGVIKDLSKILSITDGSAELLREPVNLHELIETIITDIKPAIEHADALVRNSVEPVILNLHKSYLYSIFLNLISNAIKYRSDKKPYIEISSTTAFEKITIKVIDNGIGIDLNKYREDIFKPYKRFETSIEGKGLGLFLTKSHVDALNGKLSIESDPGKGTIFTITLPVN